MVPPVLSAALVGALVGALEGLRADGLVYADFARDNIAASRMDPQVAAAVAGQHGQHAHESLDRKSPNSKNNPPARN